MGDDDFPRYEIKVPALGRAIARGFVTVAAEARDLWRGARGALLDSPARLRLVLLWEGATALLRRRYLLGLIFLAVFVFGGAWLELVGALRAALLAGAERAALLFGAEATEGEAARSAATLLAAAAAALAALAAAPFALVKAWINERQTTTAEQGHVTDRFTKAVEQLGAEKTVKVQEDGKTVERTKPNLEVRLGAIYALERIAEDSERDHIPIMETLCGCIRENSHHRKPRDFNLAPWEPLPDDADAAARVRRKADHAARFGGVGNSREWAQSLPPPRVDLQSALTVIGRRRETRLAYETRKDYRLDLRGANLQRADLAGLRLGPVRLDRARMEGADLREARMEGANLVAARMEGANLWEARMEGADLREARMEGANLVAARMEGANLRGARMEGANLGWARMEGADLRGARMEGADLGGARMEGANLWRARMEGANLRGAQLKSADLAFWNNARTNARSADFTGAKNMTQEHVDAMFGDSTTILPAGLARTDLMNRPPLEHPWSPDPEYRAWLAAGAPLPPEAAGG